MKIFGSILKQISFSKERNDIRHDPFEYLFSLSVANRGSTLKCYSITFLFTKSFSNLLSDLSILLCVRKYL